MINYGLIQYADSHPVSFAVARRQARAAGLKGVDMAIAVHNAAVKLHNIRRSQLQGIEVAAKRKQS